MTRSWAEVMKMLAIFIKEVVGLVEKAKIVAQWKRKLFIMTAESINFLN